jgi:hypothetical protein
MFAVTQCVCSCGSSARDMRWRNTAVTNPPARSNRELCLPRLTNAAVCSRYARAASTASSWHSTSGRDTSGGATANSTLTLLGALKVRSSAATRVSFSRSTSPDRGSRPAISAPRWLSSTLPSRPRLAAPVPTHRPGVSPRPA